MGESAIERGTRGANEIVASGAMPWGLDEGLRRAAELLERSEIAMVGSNGQAGYPNIKAMFKIRSDNLQHVWFSTLTSSRRVTQFKQDPRACLYFFDPEVFCGLMLTGDMAPVSDLEMKRQLWRQGWEAYYPQGVTDPEYCILQFTAQWGNFYQGLQNISFDI